MQYTYLFVQKTIIDINYIRKKQICNLIIILPDLYIYIYEWNNIFDLIYDTINFLIYQCTAKEFFIRTFPAR